MKVKQRVDDAYDLFLSTLSNKTRLAIINALQEDPMNVSELQEELDMNQTTLSHNLTRLRKCGFVTREKNGKERIYKLNKETIQPLMKLIDEHVNNYCKNRCKE